MDRAKYSLTRYPCRSLPGSLRTGRAGCTRQGLIANELRGVELSQNRGIGADVDAVFTVLNGANEAFTVDWPSAGRFALVLEMNATATPMVAVSTAAGSVFTTS